MTVTTKRVSAAPTASITKRATTTGASAGSGVSYGAFNWIGWGLAWRNCWRGFNASVGATAASPAIDATKRIGTAPSQSVTRRVTL